MIDIKIASSASDLPHKWNDLAQEDILLSKAFLVALQRSLPENIRLYFVSFYQEDNLVGIALAQHARLNLHNNLRDLEGSWVLKSYKKLISKIVKGSVLVVGNLLHTGQHAFSFSTQITLEDSKSALLSAIEMLKSIILEKENTKIRLVLAKDFTETASSYFAANKGFSKQYIQPNMVMDLLPEWKSIKDYYESLQPKYKRRFRTAKKRMSNISIYEMDEVQLEKQLHKMHQLYLNVSDNANFNTFRLPKNHFLELKKELATDFRVFGYLKENTLVGFHTLILNNNSLETYFLGYEPAFQNHHQLYLNMLYAMLEFGIEHRFTKVIFARTAIEIKSSVGAKPISTHICVKHTNSFYNLFIPKLFSFLNPTLEWEERHPFG